MSSVPGTPIFDGAHAMKGYALNKMCVSFNQATARRDFEADEDAYCDRFRLNEQQRAAVRGRDILEMIDEGGSIYYLAKLAGLLGLNMQDIGAQQTGTTVGEFKEKLRQAGA